MIFEELAKNFYFDNYHLGSFETNTPLFGKYLDSLKGIYDGDLRNGFSLQERYPYSLDLTQKVFEYDDSFMDILFANNIPMLIKQVTGMQVSLSHIQVRVCFPYPDGKSSSQEWHRDSYCYDGNYVGSFPPGIKLIFYPLFDYIPEPVLSFVPGSALSMKSNRSDDFAQITDDKIDSVKNSNSQFLLFNVSMFHSTYPVKEKNIRIIYNFLPDHLLDSDSIKCQKIWNEH